MWKVEFDDSNMTLTVRTIMDDGRSESLLFRSDVEFEFCKVSATDPDYGQCTKMTVQKFIAVNTKEPIDG